MAVGMKSNQPTEALQPRTQASLFLSAWGVLYVEIKYLAE